MAYKTTVYLDEGAYRRLKAIARGRGEPPAALVRQAVSELVERYETQEAAEPGRRSERTGGPLRTRRGAPQGNREAPVIVADTGALVALLDADDRHHRALRSLFEADPDAWVLPWAILPEVDYLAGVHLASRAQEAFHADLAAELFCVEWGSVRTSAARTL
jgi:predicted transcriptional regulator